MPRVAMGIADLMMSRTALQNATSIAGPLLTGDAVVVETPDRARGAPATPGGRIGDRY